MVRIKDNLLINIDKLDINSNGLYFILGESGCGKTTLLSVLAGFNDKYSGSVRINNKDIKKMKPEDKSNLIYNEVTYIFQSPYLFPNMTCKDNIEFYSNVKFNSKNVNELIEKFELSKCIDTKAKNLSGGEKQRTCIVRSLVNDKNIILLDEPTGALDSDNSINLLTVLKELSDKKIIIIVTHNESYARKFGDAIFQISERKIITTVIHEKNRETALNINKYPKEAKINFKFKKNYLKKLYTNNKGRKSLISFSMCISFLFFSLIFAIKAQINDSFHEMMRLGNNENTALIENKSKILRKKHSLNEEEANYILKENIELKNQQYIYDNDFNQLFKDENQFYISRTYKSISIENFNANTINKFYFLNDLKDVDFKNKQTLNEDDVIISINKKQMVEYTSIFQVEKSYKALDEIIRKNEFKLSLFVKTMEWYYEDEQIFNVVGYIVNDDYKIYHTNIYFNKIVFEDNMLLPSTIYDEIQGVPWMLKKTTIFYCEDPFAFILKSIQNPKLNNYIFTIYEEKQDTLYRYINKNTKHIICYKKPKDDINLFEIKERKLQADAFLSDKLYFAKNPLINSFIDDVYFASDKKDIHNIIDKLSKKEDHNFQINAMNFSIKNDINDKLYIDNYSKYLRNAEFSTCTGISTKIAKKFNKEVGDYIFIMVKSPTNSLYINKNFLISSFKIDSIIENDSYSVYSSYDFIFDLYINKFHLNLFDFYPNTIVLKNRNKNDILNVDFSFLTNNYKITFPYTDFQNSINSTLSTFEIGMSFMSIGSFLTTIFLIILNVKILLEELNRDIILFKVLGINNSYISSLYYSYFFKILLSGFVTSLILNVLLLFIINKTLINTISFGSVGISSVLSLFSSLPLFLIILILLHITLSIYLKKVNLSEKIRK